MTPDSDTELTRKQRREQARAERKALEEAQAQAAARRTRLMQLAGALAVVVAAVVVILLTTGGGSKGGIPKTKTAQTAVTKEVSSLIGGIPQSGNTLGNPTAPVTLVYFGDLECPICQDFTLKSLPSIIPRWVKTGKLRIEYRSLSTATGKAESGGSEPQGIFNTQQVAAYAAGKQDKAWNFIETFYHEQGEEDSGYVTEKYIQGIASQVPGLNLTQWTSDRDDASLAAQMATDAQAANNAGFSGTPSFLIGHTGENMKKLEYTNPEDPTFVNEAVEKLLKQ
jgi:protein-disulfide isomerase